MVKKCICNSDAYHSWYGKVQKTYCFRCSAYVDSETIGEHTDLCVENLPLNIPDVFGLPEQDDILWLNIPVALARKVGWYLTRLQEKKFLVLPVYRDGKMVFWTARNLESGEPKYLSAHGSKKQYWLSDEHYPTGDLFICEGIADAVYMSQIGQSMALLGTNYNGKLDSWMRSANRIIVAFDGDAVGRIHGMQLARELSDKQIGKRVFLLPIPMNLDPVDLKLDQLQNLIKELH